MSAPDRCSSRSDRWGRCAGSAVCVQPQQLGSDRLTFSHGEPAVLFVDFKVPHVGTMPGLVLTRVGPAARCKGKQPEDLHRWSIICHFFSPPPSPLRASFSDLYCGEIDNRLYINRCGILAGSVWCYGGVMKHSRAVVLRVPFRSSLRVPAGVLIVGESCALVSGLLEGPGCVCGVCFGSPPPPSSLSAPPSEEAET